MVVFVVSTLGMISYAKKYKKEPPFVGVYLDENKTAFSGGVLYILRTISPSSPQMQSVLI